MKITVTPKYAEHQKYADVMAAMLNAMLENDEGMQRDLKHVAERAMKQVLMQQIIPRFNDVDMDIELEGYNG